VIDDSSLFHNLIGSFIPIRRFVWIVCFR